MAARLTQPERTARTRQKLLAAADELWQARDFDDTTVNDICQAAGVAKGTFYLHFARKEDILLEMGFADTGELAELVRGLMADGVALDDVVTQAMASIAGHARQRPRHLMARAIQELLKSGETAMALRDGRPNQGEVFIEMFTAARRRGDITEQFLPVELGSTLALSVLQCLGWWANGRTKVKLETMLDRRAQLVLAAAARPFLTEVMIRRLGW